MGEDVHVLEDDVGAGGDEFGPALFAEMVFGGGDDAEVLVGVIDAEVEFAGGVVDVVLEVFFAGEDDAPFAGFVGWADLGFGFGFAFGDDDEEFFVAGSSEAEGEFFVFFFVDHLVFRGAELVAVDPFAAFGFVFFDVIEDVVVGAPDEGIDLRDGVREEDVVLQVFDLEEVLAVAGGVGGVGEEVAVVGDVAGFVVEEVVAGGEDVGVVDDLRADVGAAVTAEVNGVLLALFGAGGVPPVAVAVGDVFVGFVDAGDHFGVEFFLQVGGGLHAGVGVGVFGLEVLGDGGVVFFAEPPVVVNDFLVADGDGLGDAFGDGGLEFVGAAEGQGEDCEGECFDGRLCHSCILIVRAFQFCGVFCIGVYI